MREQITVHLPHWRALARDGGRHVLESALVPVGLFYLVLTLAGLENGILAALAWSLAAIGFRVVRRQRVPAVLLLTTALLVARTVLGLASGSAFLYFLQPTLQNFLIAALFLASAPLNRPLLARVAADFCAFPHWFAGHPGIRRFFQRVSLLWALVFITNGVGTLFMLAEATIGEFLLVSTAGSYTLVTLAAVVSLAWFRVCLRRAGITLRLGRRVVPA